MGRLGVIVDITQLEQNAKDVYHFTMTGHGLEVQQEMQMNVLVRIF